MYKIKTKLVVYCLAYFLPVRIPETGVYAGCPIIWTSKLQTQVTLSTTEAEYVSLSQSLREVIPVINLLEELKENNFILASTVHTVYCKAFEDNLGALELAKTPLECVHARNTSI